VNPGVASLWPTTDALIAANRDAARRALCEGDRARALAHETAAKLLELGQR
jgi:hypothetical protein